MKNNVKQIIFISAAFLTLALFVSAPDISNASGHCAEARNAAQDKKDAVLCLENQYPNIPVPPGLGLTGNFSLNDIAAKAKGLADVPLGGLVLYGFSFMVTMTGLVAFGVIIYVGVMFMMSGARPAIRAEAIGRLRGVLIGIALLLGSVIILNIINPELTLINDPTAKGGKFGSLLPDAKLEKAIREEQEKSFARRCIGDGEGGGRLEEQTIGTLHDVAKIICADRTTGPTDALIHQTLTSIVNKTECNEQDIIDIRTIIKTDPNLCG